MRQNPIVSVDELARVRATVAPRWQAVTLSRSRQNLFDSAQASGYAFAARPCCHCHPFRVAHRLDRHAVPI